ncbi:hypothetical protein ACCC94_14000, partial [Pseudomonas sp. Pseusp97]
SCAPAPPPPPPPPPPPLPCAVLPPPPPPRSYKIKSPLPSERGTQPGRGEGRVPRRISSQDRGRYIRP